MVKKLFITDFDGTLLTDTKNIHPQDIKTLQCLKKNNIVTAIATGRSLYSFMKALKAIDMAQDSNHLPVDYIIFSTGAGILEVKTNQVIFQKAIPSSKIKIVTSYLDDQLFDYMVHAANPDTRYLLYRSHGQDNPDFYRRISMYKAYAEPLADDYQHQGPATQVLAILPGKMGFEKVERVQRQLTGFSVIHATSPLDHTSVWIEIFHKDVSKSRTADYLAQKLDIEPADVISVGNDYNDQDLLDWSGIGFMVENGPETLKQKFEVVPSNNQCGVTQAAEAAGLLG
ncbi:MAG: HAD family hydrolase [Pseudomonadota bacterium]